MSSKKPQPLISRTKRERCPVCGEISYSLTGVHPQCAMRQADAKRLRRSKIGKPGAASAKPAGGAKSWQRICPKCKSLQHVRKKICNCGHTFAVRAAPPRTESDLT